MYIVGAFFRGALVAFVVLAAVVCLLSAANACDDEEEHSYGDFRYDVPLSEQDRSSHVDPDEIEPYSNDDLLNRLKEIKNMDLL